MNPLDPRAVEVSGTHVLAKRDVLRITLPVPYQPFQMWILYSSIGYVPEANDGGYIRNILTLLELG